MSDKPLKLPYSSMPELASKSAGEPVAYFNFWRKYALGGLSAPSCLCCGELAKERAVQHAELPDIFVCKRCKEATTAPPDLAAEVKRLTAKLAAAEKDAGRYRYIRHRVHGEKYGLSGQCFVFDWPLPHNNIMKGSVAEHLDDAIDAAMPKEQG